MAASKAKTARVADKKRRAARTKKNEQENLDADIKRGTTTVNSRAGDKKKATAKRKVAIKKRKAEVAKKKKKK